MLDKYSKDQPEFVEFVNNLAKTNKISHAYLIEKNNYSGYKDLVIDFAKFLLYNNENSTTNLSNLINKTYLTDCYFIEAEGTVIKKEQITDLIKEYSKKSLNNQKRVYIINNAEKLNKYSANALLKFLEDPYDNTVGILVVDNRNQIIETLKSRCQLISLCNDDCACFDNVIKDKIFDFLLLLVYNFEEAFVNINETYFEFCVTKEDHILAFSLLELICNDIINLKFNKSSSNFLNDSEKLEKLSLKLTLQSWLQIETIITKYSQVIKTNANINLLIDKVLIEIKGVVSNDKISGN